MHHSYHPTHINKNFAFMFPVWDVIFGTYRMPATNADVKFGLSEREEEEFTSCLGIYPQPFRNAYRSLRRADRGLTGVGLGLLLRIVRV